jgi:hypothetical protein
MRQQGGRIQTKRHDGSSSLSATNSATESLSGEYFFPAPFSRRDSAARSGTTLTEISSGFDDGRQSKVKPGFTPNFLAISTGMEIMFFEVTVVVMDYFLCHV